MKILLASSELHPYSKTGGMADMAGSLAKALVHAGQQVGVVTPLYRGIRECFTDLRKLDWYMELPLGSRRVQAEVWTLQPILGLTVYFFHHPDFYHPHRLTSNHASVPADN